MNFLRKKMQEQKGFTMIEVIIAIVVLSLALVPMMMIIPNILMDSAVVEYMDIGSRLAEQQVERVLSLPFSSVVAEPTTAYTGDFSDYNYAIAIGADGVLCSSTASCKDVDITISHNTVGDIMTVRTYVTDA